MASPVVQTQSVKYRRPRQRRMAAPLGLAALPLPLFLALPLLALLVRLNWAELPRNLSATPVVQAMGLSMAAALIATGLAVTLGTPLAFLLARRQFRGRVIVDTLIDLPMVLPPSVAGIALLMAFGRRGTIGAPLSDMGINIAFTETAVVLAQFFVAAPYFVKAAAAGFASVERELEQAAAIDGADRWQIFRRITMPLAWHGILGGAVMTWARAVGEFGATIIFAGNLPGKTQTMPLAIYIGFERDLGMALTLAVILLGVSFTVLVIVKRVLRIEQGT